jgi:hypothetical protein
MTNAANFNDYSGDGVFGRDNFPFLLDAINHAPADGEKPATLVHIKRAVEAVFRLARLFLTALRHRKLMTPRQNLELHTWS